MAKLSLLLHISDRDKWTSIFRLIEHFIQTVPEKDLQIAVLADVFAGAVCIACNQTLRQQMIDFTAAGHRILICEESLRCVNIKPEALPDFVHPVPNGLQEILTLTTQAYRYIKV